MVPHLLPIRLDYLNWHNATICIVKLLNSAQNEEFRSKNSKAYHQYGNGNAAAKRHEIVETNEIITSFLLSYKEVQVAK